MSEAISVAQHRAEAPRALRVAVMTVSDTRTPETDTSGALIVSMLEAAGHTIGARVIVPDDPARMRPLLESWRDNPELDAALLTGGTGITQRDQTYETVSALLTKPLIGYGEIFRMLSYHDIGPAAILSRAIGGLMGHLIVLVMPGSQAAVRLAMEKIIVPELPHFVREARKK